MRGVEREEGDGVVVRSEELGLALGGFFGVGPLEGDAVVVGVLGDKVDLGVGLRLEVFGRGSRLSSFFFSSFLLGLPSAASLFLLYGNWQLPTVLVWRRC